jgi:hypothetical protein
MREPSLQYVPCQLSHGVEQHERDVSPDDRGKLEQLLVFSREPVDPGRQDHLHGRRDLNRMDWPGQTIRVALPDERLGLHQRPDALLDEKWVPAFHQQSLKWVQLRVVA